MKEKYIPYNKSLMFVAENFARACKEATRKFYKEASFKVSHEEYIILETIYLNPGIIQFDIAKKLFMQRSYVCKTLIKLEEAGYIKKEAAIKGKRKTIIKLELTKNGKKVYEGIRNYINKAITKYPEERLEKGIETAEYLLLLTEEIREKYNLKL